MSRNVKVAALAGRRVDRAGASTIRFPASSIPKVRAGVEQVFLEEGIGLLVSAAASGADLIALEVAQRLRIRCRVVLPFEASRFRATSVVDQSNDWGVLYDSIISEVEAMGDLVVLEGERSDDAAYAYTTIAILKEANAAAHPQLATAILIWDGTSRGEDDFADQFRRLARAAGMRERVISTL